MHGDDLAIFLFWITWAVGFGLEAVKAETVLRRACFGALSAIFLIMGLSWTQIEDVWPRATMWVDSVATNPVSWFILFMFIAAVFAFHRPKVKPAPLIASPLKAASERPVSAIPEPAEKRVKEPEKREFISPSVTLFYLMSLYRESLKVHADQIAKPYLNKWARLTAKVDDVVTYGTFPDAPFMVVGEIKSGDDPRDHVRHHMVFDDKKWNERLTMLRRGEEFLFVGKIEMISSTYMQFTDCEIVES
ncbi:MAG TPA: hypothetical protein VGZ49_01135 [Xanthobacteraceae bacterium]|jgi:hypothetical protein|nr:hypothetical protein [Xanthobacteraceae bacterium]